jgi:hypothetical protein
MVKRLIAAEAIEQGDALTCVGVEAGLGPGVFDCMIGVIRPGMRDYEMGPIGFASVDHAAGSVMHVDPVTAGVVEMGSLKIRGDSWQNSRSTLLADLLAVRDLGRQSGREIGCP